MKKAGPVASQRRIMCGALLIVALAQPAGASFVVDSTADAPDANPGDAVCASAADGCTLRAAVEEANASPGFDEIQLAWATYPRTIAAELEVTDDLSIFALADAATIDAMGLGRVLHVHPGVTARLGNVVVRHGSDDSPEGGAGILNEGTLRLTHVAVAENTGPFGAGIRNTGSLVLEDAFIIYNGPGAGIDNDGHADIQRSEISRQDGIGLVNTGSATLDLTHVDHNSGGGIFSYALGVPFPPWVQVERSLLWANDGIGALYTTGTAYLKRTTVSGNTGVYGAVYALAGTLTLEDATVGANGRPNLPAAALEGTDSATVKAINTIVGGNVSSMGNPDCRVTVTSYGHNLMSCPLAAPDPTTLTGDPRLAPLKAVPVLWPTNGGTTMVHALLPGSPAIDHGACTGWNDQRGLYRPQGSACDIGAFENIPLCTGGVGMERTRLSIRRRPDGSTMVKVRGRLLFMDPGTPVLDPLADGLQLRIESSSPAGAFLERTSVTEPLVGVDLGCGGWRADSSGMRFRWKSAFEGILCAPGHVGKIVVVLKDGRAGGGGIDFAASASGVLPVPLAPLRATVVLGAEGGACAEKVFGCVADVAGTRWRCS